MKINSIIHSGLVAGTVIFSSLSFGAYKWDGKEDLLDTCFSTPSTRFTTLGTDVSADLTSACAEIKNFTAAPANLSLELDSMIVQLTLLDFELEASHSNKTDVQGLLTSATTVSFFSSLIKKFYSVPVLPNAQRQQNALDKFYTNLDERLDLAVSEYWVSADDIHTKVAPKIVEVATAILNHDLEEYNQCVATLTDLKTPILESFARAITPKHNPDEDFRKAASLTVTSVLRENKCNNGKSFSELLSEKERNSLYDALTSIVTGSSTMVENRLNAVVTSSCETITGTSPTDLKASKTWYNQVKTLNAGNDLI
jgi:hypothetical protein